jgi:hypothetical protein
LLKEAAGITPTAVKSGVKKTPKHLQQFFVFLQENIKNRACFYCFLLSIFK